MTAMSEKIPTFKNQESPEQKLIQSLKDNGIENPETKELLLAWTQEQEQRAEKSNDPEASIKLNLQRARLYFNAGYIDEAYENFEAARTQAHQENKDKLLQAIGDEMDELGL